MAKKRVSRPGLFGRGWKQLWFERHNDWVRTRGELNGARERIRELEAILEGLAVDDGLIPLYKRIGNQRRELREKEAYLKSMWRWMRTARSKREETPEHWPITPENVEEPVVVNVGQGLVSLVGPDNATVDMNYAQATSIAKRILAAGWQK